MTQEDIEKEAIKNIEFQGKLDLGSIIENSCRESFVLGANWRINTAWHDATEVPKKKGYILVWTKCFGFVTWNVNVEPAEWNKICKDNQVVEWAYIEDLIPNKED
jgi:hypothetical protein|nr:MAG TPA: hypothetical protein [Caudoviricetes sp.]